jgi:hypothetical protein
MENAKNEFMEEVKGKVVLCADITFGEEHWSSDEILRICTLAVGYTAEEYLKFLDSLDFTYDNGYGGQELFGLILCEKDIWITRGEYDGSEWWETHSLPDVPKRCYR